MKILIDTNVIITYLTNREDKYAKEVDIIMEKCITHQIEGFVAFHSLSTIWYLLRRSSFDSRLHGIEFVCKYLRISYSDNELLLEAIKNTDFQDFEDNLQDCCAQTVGADYIVTATVRDYDGHSVVKAVTPSELLSILNEADDSYSDSKADLEVHEQHIEYSPQGVAIPFRVHFHILLSCHAA